MKATGKVRVIINLEMDREEMRNMIDILNNRNSNIGNWPILFVDLRNALLQAETEDSK